MLYKSTFTFTLTFDLRLANVVILQQQDTAAQ